MSNAEHLQTNNPDVSIVEPNVERDAILGVQWLQGDLGRRTLTLMGVADEDNNPTTLEYERQRVKDFIEKNNQLNWMIAYQGKVIGSVWADLEQVGNVPSPAIHIMIGDPEVRGKGIGFAATSRVITYLESQGADSVYSRHLTNNNSAGNLLASLGFSDLSEPYIDKDGLEWQNVVKPEEVKANLSLNSDI